MSTVKPENHIVIHGWMLTDLELKGSELIIYAVIYGFTQNTDNQLYTGSLTHLSDWANISKVSVIKTLTSLCEKGLIDKYEEYRNGVKFCSYKATDLKGGKETLPGVKNLNRGSKESLLGGGKETLPNNIVLDIKDNKKEKEEKQSLDYILYRVDGQVQEAVKEFIKMRKTIKAPMTDRAIVLMINKLKEMASDPETQIAILNQSIENSWKGLYPLKTQNNQTKLKGGWTGINRETEDFYSSFDQKYN